jgi:putative hemolysin
VTDAGPVCTGPYKFMRKIVVGILALVLLAGIGLAVLMSDRFTPEGRRARTLERLLDEEIVVRRACGLGAVYVNRERWERMSDGDRSGAADALAAYCVTQGGEATLAVHDADSGNVLERWTGSALEPVR